MGGEKGSTSIVLPMTLGSPPRRRGKVLTNGLVHGIDGITPAWAGKRAAPSMGCFSCWDHPRVGGEKLKTPIPALAGIGSPPRGRGKELCGVLGNEFAGITPAWAGKSRPAGTHRKYQRDHPRVGGEKSVRKRPAKRGVGSPPRGRGKVYPFRVGPVAVRITPAWAGKSLFCFTAAVPIQDHPRVGGEKELGDRFKTAELGSPPRRRGKGWRVVDHHPLPGITPAQAGKSITFLP